MESSVSSAPFGSSKEAGSSEVASSGQASSGDRGQLIGEDVSCISERDALSLGHHRRISDGQATRSDPPDQGRCAESNIRQGTPEEAHAATAMKVDTPKTRFRTIFIATKAWAAWCALVCRAADYIPWPKMVVFERRKFACFYILAFVTPS